MYEVLATYFEHGKSMMLSDLEQELGYTLSLVKIKQYQHLIQQSLKRQGRHWMPFTHHMGIDLNKRFDVGAFQIVS